MKCPGCGSENCQFITSTETRDKSFGIFDAICGYICLGPLGLLCGFCGAESETKTHNYWVCQECGKKFTERDIRKQERLEAGGHSAETSDTEPAKEPVPKISFYTETASDEMKETNSEWNRIREEYEKRLEVLRDVDMGQPRDFFERFLWVTPPYATESYVSLEKSLAESGSANARVYLAVLEEGGVLFTDRGLFIRNHLERIVVNVFLFENYVYVNQSCICFKNQYDNKKMASEFYDFIKSVYPFAHQNVYTDYEELLAGILEEQFQKSTGSESNWDSWYGNQEDYKNCIDRLSNEVMLAYRKAHPEAYKQYLQKREEAQKANVIQRTFRKAKLRDSYLSLLPKELEVLLTENEAKRKNGGINPKKYRELIHLYEKVAERPQIAVRKESEVFCIYCGKPIERTSKFCIYCGKKFK